MQEKNPIRLRHHDRAGQGRSKVQDRKKKARAERLEEKRRGAKHRNGRLGKLLVRLGILALVVVLISLIAVNWDYLSPEAIFTSVSDLIRSGEGDGYPVELDGSTVKQVKEAGNAFAFLNDTALVMMNHNGAEVSSHPLNYSDPLLRTAGRYVLVAEVGGLRYALYTRSRTVLNVTADNLTDDANRREILSESIHNRIISANVRADGTVALVTEASQSYTSEVLVYSAKGKKLFHQQNSTLMALDVALSPNHKTVAVVGVQTVGGEMQSVVRIYNLSNAELLTEKTLNGTMLFAAQYFDNGRLFAAGDNACITMEVSGRNEQMYTYSDRELLGFDVADNEAALALQDYGSMDGGEVVLINGTGKPKATCPFEGTYRSISTGSGRCFLLTAGNLYAVGDDGSFSGEKTVSPDSRLVAAYGRNAMVFSLTHLDAHSFS